MFDKRKFYYKGITQWDYLIRCKNNYKDKCPLPSSICRRWSELNKEFGIKPNIPYIFTKTVQPITEKFDSVLHTEKRQLKVNMLAYTKQQEILEYYHYLLKYNKLINKKAFSNKLNVQQSQEFFLVNDWLK